MTLKPFFAAPCGRVLAGTVAFACLAAGLVALGPGAIPPFVIPLVVIVCIVGSIMSVGLAIERFPGMALVLLLTLPFAGGFYFAGSALAAQAGPPAAMAMLALGLLSAWLATGAPFRASSSMPRRTAGAGSVRR